MVVRRCGDCQLCCRLLPVRPLQKGANEACKYQRFHKGCTVYRTPAMPPECSLWNCRWLQNDDTADLGRPDRTHYVIDAMPDFVTAIDNETGATHQVEVVQIWVDPSHPNAHRDPALRAYMWRRARDGVAALVRFNSKDAITIFAPVDPDEKWIEHDGQAEEESHSARDIANALGISAFDSALNPEGD